MGRGVAGVSCGHSQKKFHWCDENSRRQRAITTIVAALDYLHLVVVRIGDSSDNLLGRGSRLRAGRRGPVGPGGLSCRVCGSGR